MDAAEHDDKRRREDPSRTMKAAPAGTRTSSRRGTRAFLVVLFALTVVWYLVSSRGSLRFASKNGRSQTAQQQDSAPASLPEADLNSSKTSTDLSTATTSMHPTRTLLPLMFTPLPLGSINPTGWLLNELQTSAQGLAGHLHDFYPYVKDSPWIGGESEYSGLHEAFPYWFNGLVYLSHSLPDEDQDAGRLRDQVREAADEVLRRQADDGWLGPEVGEERLLWGRWPLLLGFVGLVEANPRTWEGKLVPATQQFVKLAHNMLKDGGKGYLPQNPGVSQGDSTDWGRVRAADYMIVLQWLLEEYPGEMDDVLYDSMRILYDGMLKWEAWYNGATYVKEDLNDFPENVTDAYFPWLHGVNVGQGRLLRDISMLLDDMC